MVRNPPISEGDALMRLTSTAFVDGGWIPSRYAFARIDPAAHVALSENLNPQLAWSEPPVGTQSFAVICHDIDVPSVGDDVNQPDREIAQSLPRVDFYHWVLIDLPASVRSLDEGAFSEGVTAGGKTGPAAPLGARQGINDYTGWFAGDAQMAGDYYGYDGPCPPWNDARLHRYVWTVYALDVDRLPLLGRFSGADALKVIAAHTLGEARLTGLYSLNPRLQPDGR
jgi:Raf kinase inhibitor-like YbhB/YbcL family protein